VPLHTKESQHQTGHHFFLNVVFGLIYLNCGSVAAPQQGVAAPAGAPDLLSLLLLLLLLLLLHHYLNGASGAASQQVSRGTKQGTRFFDLILIYIFQFISIVHQVPLHNKELRHQTRHNIFLLNLFYLSIGIVPQVPLHNKESQHQTGHQSFILYIYFDSFEWCIRYRRTINIPSTICGARLFFN
jgi:hypothetical protein